MKNFPFIQIAQLADEMSSARLGDARRDKRAGGLVEMLAADPGASFPEAARDSAELQAFYQFLRMEATGPGPVVAPHVEATAERLQQHEGSKILVAHDTTDFEFSELFKPGLGPVNGEHGWGFLMHASLAIQAEGPALPLGVISTQMWRREIEGHEGVDEDRDPSKDPLPTMENERVKWKRGVEAVEQQIQGGPEAVHLMDRGADSYPLIAKSVEAGQTFVLRSNQNRRITDELEGVERPKLDDAFEDAPVVDERTVSLSARDNSDRPPSAHPSREARQATLEIRAASVSIRRPHAASAKYPESVDLQVVWAHEKDPPEGCEAVHWRLLTNQSVESSEDAVEVVEQYCVRWVIEELFGALKGPIRPEDRQLRSGQTYSTALALMLPVAWRLLFIRTLTHHAPQTPAEEALRGSQLGVLAADSKTDFDDPQGLTVREALLGIGSLGGHLPRNGLPGWQLLQRGYQRLLLGEIKWIQGRQQLKRKIQEKWVEADDPQEFDQWLEELQIRESPMTYDQS